MAWAWPGPGQDQQAVSDKIRVVISVRQTTGEPAAWGMEKNNKQTKNEKKRKANHLTIKKLHTSHCTS